MKNFLTLLTFCLLCLGDALAQTRTLRMEPWAYTEQTTCLQKKEYLTSGALISVTPEVGREMVISVNNPQFNGAGMHYHEAVGGTPRPPGQLLDPTHQLTVLDTARNAGCVYFHYTPMANDKRAFSDQFVLTTSAYSNAPPLMEVTPDIWIYEARGVDYIQGQEYPLTRLNQTQYMRPFSDMEDTRHTDQYGITNYSRYGTVESVHKIKLLAYHYATMLENPDHFKLAIIRGSGQQDGDMDNEMTATGIYPMNSQNSSKYFNWGIGPISEFNGAASGDEGHRHGTGWDIVNPRLSILVPGYESFQDILWTQFKIAVLESGCRFGLLDPQSGVVVTNVFDTIDWWKTKNVVHINCGPNERQGG